MKFGTRHHPEHVPPSPLSTGHTSGNATCCNCGIRHLNAASPNCFFVSLRLSGRLPLALKSTTKPERHTRTIPKDPRQRIELREELWAQFQGIKADSELRRHNMAAGNTRVPKGELRAKEPIPWLSWCSFYREKGQTRSEDNFRVSWERHVEEPLRRHHGTKPFYITSPLLDAPTDEEDEVDEEDLGNNKFAALQKISGSPP